MNEPESPYAAPRAPLEDASQPPQDRGSVVLGFFLGWAALLAGSVLAVAWIMFMIMVAAVDSGSAEAIAPIGFIVVPLLPLWAARVFGDATGPIPPTGSSSPW